MTETAVEVRHVTNSELQTFKECRRKWFLGYHKRLTKKIERSAGPLKLGSRVHECLAEYYTGSDPVAFHAKCIERDRALLAEDILPEELKLFESEAVLGQLMLEGYLEWLQETGADQGLTAISAETKLSSPLGVTDGQGRPVHLLGKLDLKVRREMDGAVLVLDHKTSQSFRAVYETLVIQEQFLTYQLLERLRITEDPESTSPPATGSIVSVLRKVKRSASAKPPFYGREEVHHSDAELRNFYYRLHAEVAQILSVEAALAAGGDHRFVCYPSPSRDCTWKCSFFAACHMFEDGSDVERFLQDHYTEYNPLDRYEEPKDDETE